MKPTKLTMSAFGPYADKTVIDMESLGESGIYLITGDTGAGKTTIFDAVSYALYGRASGDSRESDMLRSKYAKDETPTYVELEFVYQGKAYTIRRNPEYLRPKNKGVGTTMQSAGGSLIFPDGRPPLIKIGEINSAIVELLGLERDQFAQIAMIAQGDFLRLLLAKTDVRREIFRKIFKTRPYEVFQEKMNRRALDLEQKHGELQRSLQQHMESVIWEEGGPLGEMIGEAQEDPSRWPAEETAARIRRLIDRDEETLEKTNARWEDLEKELAEVHHKMGELQRIKDAEEKLFRERERLSGELPKLERAEQTLREEEKQRPEMERLAAWAAAAGDRLPRYDKLEGLERDLRELKSSCETLSGDVKVLEVQAKELAEELQKDEKNLASMGDPAGERARREAEAARMGQRRIDLLGLERDLGVKEKKEQALAAAQEKYKLAAGKYGGERAAYGRMEQAFLDSQAGLLAKGLVDGEACPVCGSLDHPSPGEAVEGAPSEEELRAAGKKLEKLREVSAKCSEEASLLLGQVQEGTEIIVRQGKKLLGSSRDIPALLPSALEAAEADEKQVKTALAAAEEKLAEKTSLEENLPKIREHLEKKSAEILEKKEDLIQRKGRMEQVAKQIQGERKELEYPDKQAAEAEIQKAQTRRRTIEKAIKAAEEARRASARAVDDSKAAIHALESQAATGEKRDEEDLLSLGESLSREKEELDRNRTAIHRRYSLNCQARTAMEKKKTEMEKIGEERKWVKALSDTVNAKVSGKEKIMLETYVQMTYFDRILSRANVRFMKMSGGQYELKRRETAGNFQSQSGLELDIIDHYNGTERSAASLSGGESFMASLSLALGLSEEIQASAGGIRLDTMFVDEGFGSLDESSLSLAMKALWDLSEGNRLVGIISHVGELKERIDKQIVVTKERSGGSRVKIVL